MANKLWIGTNGAYGTNGNWSPTNVPTTGDDVRLAYGGSAISSTLDQSAVAIGDFIVESGFSAAIGSASGAGSYLQLDPDRFEFAGTGQALIDLGSAAITAQIFDSATPNTGDRGLFLKGSALAGLNVLKGRVGLAARHGETSAVTTATVNGVSADLWIGEGTTLTTLNVLLGTCRVRSAATTINLFGGTLYLEEVGTVTTVNVYGGTLFPNSSGTITTMNVLGGTVDWTKSGVARTVSTLNLKRGTSWSVKLNKESVTYSAIAISDSQTLSGGSVSA